VEIVPLVGNQPITAGSVIVRVNPDDRIRVAEAVERSSAITHVNDDMTLSAAKRMAGEIKSLLDEIQDSKKAAKRPFAAVEKAIDALASEVGQPVQNESQRVLGLINGYVTELERRAKIEAREKERLLQAQIDAQRAKLREAQAAQEKAEAEARAAKDEAARIRAHAEAERRKAAAEQAQLAAEMAREVSMIGVKPKQALVQGGRVDHKFEFTLEDVYATVSALGGQGWKLLRWELDIRACQDACKAQLEKDPDVEPKLPGISVKRTVNVSVRATARTE